MGKIFAFTNQKGGVGKTTTCVNVAAYLATDGYRVLLIDLDPQGNASSGLGYVRKLKKDGDSVYTVLCGDTAVGGAVVDTEIETLKLLPSSIDLAGAEIELAQVVIGRERVLADKLATIDEDYDYVMIDCPPSLGLLTVNALTAADGVIIPIQCEYYALEGLSQIMNTVRLVKKFLRPSLQVSGAVLTLYDSRSKLSHDVAEEIGGFFGDKVFETRIPRNVRLAEAPSFGKPIVLYDKKCSGAVAYRKLADEFRAKLTD